MHLSGYVTCSRRYFIDMFENRPDIWPLENRNLTHKKIRQRIAQLGSSTPLKSVNSFTKNISLIILVPKTTL